MTVQSDRLPATTFVWQPAPGKYTLTAVAKATFLLAPGDARLAPEQEPMSDGDGHWDDNPARSLFIPSDIAPPKSRIDEIAAIAVFLASDASSLIHGETIVADGGAWFSGARALG